jgi:predicted  nucleic acid-binding Zn-ribbon protein
MADNVVEYIIKIDTKKGKVNLKKLSGDLKKTQKDLDKTGKKGKLAMAKLAGGAKKARAAMAALKGGLTTLGIAAGAAGVGIFALMKQQADYVNSIADTSARTGIAVKNLAGLKLAAESSGIAFSSIETSLNGFIPKLTEAMEKTSRTRKFFDGLGVSVQDNAGKLRNTNAVFEETVLKLGAITDKATQSAYAYQIFGQEAGAALIQSGALENLDEFKKRAESIGPALDENAIKKAAEFQRGWAELKTSIMGSIGDIFVGLTGEKSIGKAMSIIASDMKYYSEAIVEWFRWIGQQFAPILEGMQTAANIITGDFTLPDVPGITSAPLGPGYGALDMVQPVHLSDEEYNNVLKALEDPLHFLNKAHKKIAKMDKKIKDKGYDLYPDLGEPEHIARLERRKGREDYKSKEMQIYKDMATRHLMDEHERNISAAESTFDEVWGNLVDRKDLRFKPTKRGQGKKPGKSKDFVPFIPTGPTEEDKKAVDNYANSQKNLFDVFENIAEIVPKLNNNYEKLNNRIDETAKEIAKAMETGDFDTEKMLEKVSDLNFNVDDLKNEWIALGYDGTEAVQPLIAKLKELGKQAEEAARKTKKLSDIKFGIDISTTMVDIAGGNIVGGAAGLVSAMAPALGPVAGSIASLVGSLESLGNQLMAAEDAALQQHIDRLIARQEELLNRGLSDEEKKAIEDGLSSPEIARIKKEAREAMVKDRAEKMTEAIVLGLTELPVILMEIMPALVWKAAYEIVKAIVLLPGRMIGALGKGIVDWLKMLGQIIKDAVTVTPGEVVEGVKSGVAKAVDAIKGFVGLGDDKRTGGRFISARSGIRYTGMSDGLAMLHRNEFVVPESGARPQAINRIIQGQQSGGGITINVNADIVERNAVEEIVRKIERQFLDFGTAKSTLF